MITHREGVIAPRLPAPRATRPKAGAGQELGHSYDSAPGPYGDARYTTAEAAGEKMRSIAMTAIARIARRVASVVDEMNYAQRRTMELFLGLGENRR